MKRTVKFVVVLSILGSLPGPAFSQEFQRPLLKSPLQKFRIFKVRKDFMDPIRGSIIRKPLIEVMSVDSSRTFQISALNFPLFESLKLVSETPKITFIDSQIQSENHEQDSWSPRSLDYDSLNDQLEQFLDGRFNNFGGLSF